MVRDLWDNRSAVFLDQLERPRKLSTVLVNRLETQLKRFLPWKPDHGRRLRYPTAARAHLPGFPSQIDFCAGIAAQASPSKPANARFSGNRALHITEIALALNNTAGHAQPYVVKSTF